MSTKSARRRRNKDQAQQRARQAAALNTAQRPRLSLVKERHLTAVTTPAVPPLPICSPVTDDPEPTADQRYARLREYIDTFAAEAALYAGALGIHAAHNTWTGMSNSEATTVLTDETRLLYNRDARPRLTAWRQCRHQQWHTRPVGSEAQIETFRNDVARCARHTTTIQGFAVLALHNTPQEYAHA